MKKNLLSIALLLFLSASASAQNRRFEAGILLNALTYQGDLTDRAGGKISNAHLQYGLSGTFNFKSSLSARLSLLRAGLHESDSEYPVWRAKRGFKFSSKLTELSSVVEWSFLKISSSRFSDYGSSRFSCYLLAGMGWIWFNPDSDWSDLDRSFFAGEKRISEGLAKDSTANFRKSCLMLPVGMGIKFVLKEKFILRAEVIGRKVFTDYLDGFHKSTSPTTDSYFTYGLGFSYCWDN